MATYEYELFDPPATGRARELWLQHAAGFIFFEDMRRYAVERMDPNLGPELREAVQKGMTGGLSNDSHDVEVSIVVRHASKAANGDHRVVDEMDLAEGDGMCLGYHGWIKGDFGSNPVVRPKMA
jgi:hypothetical protein